MRRRWPGSWPAITESLGRECNNMVMIVWFRYSLKKHLHVSSRIRALVNYIPQIYFLMVNFKNLCLYLHILKHY